MFEYILNTPLVLTTYLSSISVVENHSKTFRKFLVLKLCESSFISEKFFFRLTEMHSSWRFKSKTEALIKRNSFSQSRYLSISLSLSMRNSDFGWKFSGKKQMFLRVSFQTECWILSHLIKRSGVVT